MLKTVWRTAAIGASTLGLLVMAACSGSDGREAPPPPVATEHHADRSPELLGGPPAPRPAAVADQRAFPTMRPIANPRDMSRAERLRVYGHRYDYAGGYGRHGRAVPHAAVAATPPAPVVAKAAPVVASPAPAPAPVVAAAPVAPPAPVAAAPAVSAPAASPEHAKLHFPSFSLPSWLSIPGVPQINIPGFAHPVASKNVVGWLILLIAVLLLVIAARGSGAKKPKAQAAKASPTANTPAGAAEVAEEPAPMAVAHEGPSFQADDFGGPAHVAPAHVEPAVAETAVAAAALPEALAVHYDPPAHPAAEPEAAPVYAEAPAPEAAAHEPVAHEHAVAETPAEVTEAAADPVAHAAPDHVEAPTPETFDWQSLTHAAPAAPVAEAVDGAAAHAEAPEALGHEALKFSDHAFPAAEPARESEPA